MQIFKPHCSNEENRKSFFLARTYLKMIIMNNYQLYATIRNFGHFLTKKTDTNLVTCINSTINTTRK